MTLCVGTVRVEQKVFWHKLSPTLRPSHTCVKTNTRIFTFSHKMINKNDRLFLKLNCHQHIQIAICKRCNIKIHTATWLNVSFYTCTLWLSRLKVKVAWISRLPQKGWESKHWRKTDSSGREKLRQYYITLQKVLHYITDSITLHYITLQTVLRYIKLQTALHWQKQIPHWGIPREG